MPSIVKDKFRKNSSKAAKDKHSHKFTIMLTPEERADLERLARHEGMSAGAYFRLLLRKTARQAQAA